MRCTCCRLQSGASPREDFASDSSTTLENEASGDESGLSLGPGHPDDGDGGSSSEDSEDPPEVEAKRPSRRRSRVLRFEAGSATIDNKLRQIGHGFVPVGRSPGASSGTSPDVADSGGASYGSYSSPRKPGQPHGSPNRRRSNSIMSPAGALGAQHPFVGRSPPGILLHLQRGYGTSFPRVLLTHRSFPLSLPPPSSLPLARVSCYSDNSLSPGFRFGERP